MKRRSYFSGVSLVIAAGIFLAGCGSELTKDSKETVVKEKRQVEEKSQQASKKAQEDKFYFTANEGGTISKVNAMNNEVVKTIQADGVVHNIQVSPDGKTVAATIVPSMGAHGGDEHDDGGHEMKMNGTALFYDTESDELLKEVEVGSHPAHIVYTEDGKYALVTNNEDNSVSVIDTQDYTVLNTIGTGEGPHGFRISSDSKYAYIANMGEDSVSVINLETMKEERKIQVGAAPVTTGISTDGKTLVATLNAENALAIVDLESGNIEKVGVGIGPAQVYLASNNEFAYVANQGTESNPSNSITIVDLKSKAAISTIETGKGAHGVVLSEDSNTAYVTNMFENTVSIIDLITKEVKQTIKVGEVPNGITIMK
jgi:YVTN family beta-propeller protein